MFRSHSTYTDVEKQNVECVLLSAHRITWMHLLQSKEQQRPGRYGGGDEAKTVDTSSEKFGQTRLSYTLNTATTTTTTTTATSTASTTATTTATSTTYYTLDTK